MHMQKTILQGAQRNNAYERDKKQQSLVSTQNGRKMHSFRSNIPHMYTITGNYAFHAGIGRKGN